MFSLCLSVASVMLSAGMAVGALNPALVILAGFFNETHMVSECGITLVSICINAASCDQNFILKFSKKSRYACVVIGIITVTHSNIYVFFNLKKETTTRRNMNNFKAL